MGQGISKMDKTNRVYIPPELSRTIHLVKDQAVTIKSESGKLIIRPVTSKDIQKLM